MPLSSKIRVGVLRGGPSSEYDISLKSGGHVLKNLPERYAPVDIFVDKTGVWHVHGVAEAPTKALKKADVVFNALHGEYGEDGALQHFLDALGVPYTGSRTVASALAMHKARAKDVLKQEGIRSPYHKLLRKDEALPHAVSELWRTVPNPSIVKPVARGSSIGVSVARSFPELAAALEKAFSLSDTALIEEYIQGREATCGVVSDFRGEDVYALLPVEFVHAPGVSFLDYDAKYAKKTDRKSQAIHPGRFSAMEKEAIQTAARAVHRVLGLSHYSRSDFIVSPRRGIYFLEVNSLPGLYADAPFTESLAAVGAPLSEFLDHVLTLALERK